MIRITHALLGTLVLGALGCSKPLIQFTPEIRQRYSLSPVDLQRIQFYVGVMDGPLVTDGMTQFRELSLKYRSSATERAAENAALSTRTVVTEKDFVVADKLPGVYVVSATGASESLDIDIGSGAILTFRSDGRGSAYRLAAINGAPYTSGSRVEIRGINYVVETPRTVELLFNESNALKTFKQRVAAEGRRVK